MRFSSHAKLTLLAIAPKQAIAAARLTAFHSYQLHWSKKHFSFFFRDRSHFLIKTLYKNLTLTFIQK